MLLNAPEAPYGSIHAAALHRSMKQMSYIAISACIAAAGLESGVAACESYVRRRSGGAAARFTRQRSEIGTGSAPCGMSAGRRPPRRLSEPHNDRRAVWVWCVVHGARIAERLSRRAVVLGIATIHSTERASPAQSGPAAHQKRIAGSQRRLRYGTIAQHQLQKLRALSARARSACGGWR